MVYMVNSHPIEKPDLNQSEEIIFVPYDVKYVPIEITSHSASSDVEKTIGSEVKQLQIKSEELENFRSDKKKQIDFLERAETEHKNHKDEETLLEISESSEDYVLVPISLLKTLEDKAKTKEDSLSATHSISKRQAPGGLVFRSVIQLSTVSGNRRRIIRLPAFVGYLTEYDQFPTVA